MQVNQLLSIQKLLRLLRIARIIKLIKGFKVITNPLLSSVASLLLDPTLPLPASTHTAKCQPMQCTLSASPVRHMLVCNRQA
jgi:hypothetical protein